ncbi:MAG: VOC family protein [Spirochaetales bacterium]
MQSRMSMITLGVRDLARATSFYAQGLGLLVHSAQKNMTVFDLNGTWLSLYPWDDLAKDAGVSAGGKGFRGVTIAHNVSSPEQVDAIVAKAKAAGATVVKKPSDASWGGYHGYFADPEGHLWEVAHNPFTWIGPAEDDAEKGVSRSSGGSAADVNEHEDSNERFPPIRKEVQVPVTPGRAYQAFTRQMAKWWPLEQHSVGADLTVTCEFEPKKGGRIFETMSDGTTVPWGKVLEVEPGRKLVFTWHPGRDAAGAQIVTVKFAGSEDGSIITLEHRGWDKLDEDDAEYLYERYEWGWDGVLSDGFATFLER